MKIVSTIAPGKCILFGEHSVVYGYPAIAMAISLYSRCVIENIKEKKIQLVFKNYDKIFEFPDLKTFVLSVPSQFKQVSGCLKIFNEEHGVNFENIKLTLSSSLFPSSGLGSSASIAVALVSAISEFYEKNYDKYEISKIAFQMEKIIHGTPSGIDNTVCTHGNLIFYKKGEFSSLSFPNYLQILVSYTNIAHDTKRAIEAVRAFKNEKPDLSEKIFKEMGKIAETAEKQLLNGNLREIGNLMNENQKYLVELGVSNDTISEIVKIALRNGAYGSKLTGAGLGGCVISLGTKKELKKISRVLKERGFESFLINVDREGVKIESSK